jgi:hypothetical protein
VADALACGPCGGAGHPRHTRASSSLMNRRTLVRTVAGPGRREGRAPEAPAKEPGDQRDQMSPIRPASVGCGPVRPTPGATRSRTRPPNGVSRSRPLASRCNLESKTPLGLVQRGTDRIKGPRTRAGHVTLVKFSEDPSARRGVSIVSLGVSAFSGTSSG